MPRDRFIVAGLSTEYGSKRRGGPERCTYFVLDVLRNDREVPIPKSNVNGNGKIYWAHEHHQWSTYHLAVAEAWVADLHKRYGRIEDYRGYEAYAEL